MLSKIYQQSRLKLILSAFLFLATAFGWEAQATHLAGGDLFYVHLGGLRYRVTIRLYRDCSGINLAQETLHVSQGRCGTEVASAIQGGGTISPSRRDTQNIFCDRYATRYRCTSAVDPRYPERPSNFEAVDYVFTVNLPNRRRDWCFWWSSGARPDINNLGTGSSGNVYMDAILNNLDFDGNNSPAFSNLDVPLPYICYNRAFSYNFNTIEADGDSLRYELVAPALSCSTASTYSTYTPGILFDTLTTPPRYSVWTGGSFSATFPIASFQLTRNSAGRDVASRYFDFDPNTGRFSFIPRIYVAPQNPADGVNKHGLAVRITERRYDPIARIWRVIGITQRDFLITVVDCGNNADPNLPNVNIPPNSNGNYISRNDSSTVEINAQTCTYTNSRLAFQDTAGNLLKITFPGSGGTLPGPISLPANVGTFTLFNNNSTSPYVSLKIYPAASEVGQSYVIPVIAEDNQCPIKRRRTILIKVNILQTNFANVIKPGGTITSKDTICIGDSATIEARVLRPDTTINGERINYTYVWSKLPGLRKDTAQLVTVTPPATMRYRFTAYNDKFQGCYDTASVLVVVRSPVQAGIKSYFDAQAEGLTVEAPVSVRLTNTSSPLTDADRCSWYLQRFQKVRDSLVLDLDSGLISRRIHPDTLLELKKPGIYVVRLDVDTRTKSSARCFASAYDTIVVPEPVLQLPNAFTPNGDNVNDYLAVKVPGNEASLTIFNRYGVPVKSYERYDNTFNASGLPAGTYYYVLKDNKKGEVYKSWLQIIK